MRFSLLAAVVAVVVTSSAASAQYPVVGPDNYAMNRPTAQPWSGGGYDPRLGYWIHGGIADAPGEQWAVRAYTPVTANGYWLSQPPNTGFVMAMPVVAAPATSSRWHPCRR